MLRRVGTGVLVWAMLGGLAAGPAWSQSNAVKKAPPAQGAPTQNAAATKPKAHVAGSYGHWTLLCGKEGKNDVQERCSLVLPLIEKDSQKLIFRVILTYSPDGKLVLRVDGPTGLALQRGVEFSPDRIKIYRMAFQTCLPMGCKALLLVQDDLRNELMKSKEGTITVYALNGQAIQTVAEIDGLTEGFKALDKARKQN